MKFEMDLEDFLFESELSLEDWQKSNADWDQLSLIANDFVAQLPALTSAAEQISSRIRTFSGVHSVRWRIKNVKHLLKKIIRKKLEEPVKDKWLNICVDNYLDVVTDLIGVRALHLFKDECDAIDSHIRKVWDLCEPVVIYVRKGDEPNVDIIKRGAEAAIHDAGYRSIHYIVQSQPEKNILKAEIQVRTIFQEGWSEIDHKVKYPDHSKNEQIKVFLDLFNVLAGSADEMGSFVKNLTLVLKETEEEKNLAIRDRENALKERDEAMADIADRLNELDALKAEDSKSQKIIKQMKEDMDRLKGSQSAAGIDILASLAGRALQAYDVGVTQRTIDAVSSVFGRTLSEIKAEKELMSAITVGNTLRQIRNSQEDKD
ncbi:RelA/SpoT domain-containing protein [Pseudomonas sp. NFACC46-3]|uniref:RelA/SpoT domain-containing protein n=1 Tax=Pseudomonas sp. NFACC46-3 TaxID=1566200 RepID=UPI0008E4D33E|nr:RelA/SpoT domain-containing protein [Pseudomonas sp. NFACC46-3]SFL31587.1 ppGpp synthetase catalytic domain-containing protein (RelA/SpoT-type nucleotidyltranferase) [Pseudomonas sp. NFACC46-3]